MPDGKTFLGRGGQTSTQVVQLSKPPRSWALLPLGESDLLVEVIDEEAIVVQTGELVGAGLLLHHRQEAVTLQRQRDLLCA